jgi:HK97 family phage prohead protease
MKEKEVRKINMQFRAESNDDGEMRIKGYAVVFDSPETYGYTEVIDKHALDETDMTDVVLRYNHNDSFMVLARTRNGSLKLDKDEKGLLMDAVLQKNITDHVNVYNAIDSELIDKQSFAFTVEEDSYDYDTDTRTITKIGKLFDVSVVDQPFYNATDVSVCSKNDDFLEKRAELRKQHEEKKALEDAKTRLIEKLDSKKN